MDPRFSSTFHLARIANALELIAATAAFQAEMTVRNSPVFKDQDRERLLGQIDKARYEASRRQETLEQDWREYDG